MSDPIATPTAPHVEAALERIRAEAIDAHLRFLSHPLLEERAPGTRGAELAAEYIRAQFRRIGLAPPVGGSYFQDVPMVGLTTQPALALTLPGGEAVRPAPGDDYVAWPGVPEPHVAVDAELVYVGYGITAPEYEWDDYEDVDVRGKVLLMRVNDPGTPETPDFFGGRALTYYGRWTYKFEEASRRGAAGAILIHTDDSAGYGWHVVRAGNTREHVALAGTPEHPLPLKGWMREDAVAAALARAGHDLADLVRRAEARDFRPVATGLRVQARLESEVRGVEAANVVGLLPGGDAARGDEPVILSSHYDHLGTGVDEQGAPVVYPGAYDNASGVALLLTLAEAAASLDERPARPLLFVATTAEESGLLGAEWYAAHPLLPLARTAAVLNVDGANLEGRTRDLAPLGVDRSDVGGYVREAAAAEGLQLAPEPHPEQGMFFRQDHFPFARAGVPAVALDHGLDFEGRPEGWGERWYEEFNTRHYHQPSDAYREGLDLGGAVQQGRVMLRAALAIADADALPEWSAGAEFRRR